MGCAWRGRAAGETSPRCPRRGAASLAPLHPRIYLFTGEIPLAGPRRAPAGQKYSRTASDCCSALGGPQAFGSRAGRPREPCSPAGHRHPGPWRSLSPGDQVTVPRRGGCCVPWGDVGWGLRGSHHAGDAPRTPASSRGSPWVGSSTVTVGTALPGSARCRVPEEPRLWSGCISTRVPGGGMRGICWRRRNSAEAARPGWGCRWSRASSRWVAPRPASRCSAPPGGQDHGVRVGLGRRGGGSGGSACQGRCPHRSPWFLLSGDVVTVTFS